MSSELEKARQGIFAYASSYVEESMREELAEFERLVREDERRRRTCRQVRGEGKYGCDCPVDGIIPGCHCVCHD